MNFSLNPAAISEERKASFKPIIAYIKTCRSNDTIPQLNFICTHNSRRSQLSQLWAFIAAEENGVSINSFSGGVEATAFNERGVKALRSQGIELNATIGGENPVYTYKVNGKELKMFSKLFDNIVNPKDNFAAIMTCSHADENCPFIPGADECLPLRYEDPKAFDDQENEQEKYRERSEQIANEMFYIFSQVK